MDKSKILYRLLHLALSVNRGLLLSRKFKQRGKYITADFATFYIIAVYPDCNTAVR